MEIVVRSRVYKNQILIIDDEDYELIKRFTLNVSKQSNGFYIKVLKGNWAKNIHCFLMNPPKGKEVDHINRNPLDNRRSNLRIATHAQNSYNKFAEKVSASGFKGVYWVKDKNMWCARITHDARSIFPDLST